MPKTKIKGLKQVQGNLTRYDREIRKASRESLGVLAEQTALRVQGHANRSFNVKNVDDWGASQELRQGNQYRVGPKAELKKLPFWLEFGTKAHPIEARRAPFLFFWWVRMGKYFRGKIVRNHPGIKATMFVHRAYESILGYHETIFKQAFKRRIKL